MARTDRNGIADRMRSGFDWLFRSRVDGRIAIGQLPNAALVVFLVAAALRWVLSPDGAAAVALDVVAAAALVWWAVGEVLRGVNPFRRMLGAGVLAFVVVGLVTR